MKDVNLVLRGKELGVGHCALLKEVEALHLAIPLLAAEQDWMGLASPPPSSRDWN